MSCGLSGASGDCSRRSRCAEGSGPGCLADNVVRFRDREERERYMDSLERQMEHQREQIERTLDEIEASGRRTVLDKLRGSLPSSIPNFLNRISVRDAKGGREAATERPDSEPSRSWWQFWR